MIAAEGPTDDEVVEYFRALLLVIVRVVNSRVGVKIPAGSEWENDAQVLAVKMFRHLHTVDRLCGAGGVRLPDGGLLEFVDHTSAKVVARAALENCLVFAYVYAPEDAELRKFRHATWKLGGLFDRQKLIPLSDATRTKQSEERSTVAELQKELESNLLFVKLSVKKRSAILSGDWRVGLPWSVLAADAGFSKPFFANLYGYLCGHAHSSWASTLQVRHALRSMDEQRSLALGVMRMSLMPAAVFVETYCKVFSGGRDYLATDNAARELVYLWGSIARSVGRLYEAPRDA